MAVMTHRDRDSAIDSETATASGLSFARQKAERRRRRLIAFVKRAYPALIVYATLAVALIGVVAFRLKIWLPLYWN